MARLYPPPTYRLGQSYPITTPSIVGGAIDPAWFALNVPRGKDFAAVEHLRIKGMRAFAPEVTKISRRGRKRREVVVPALPGIVYARFDRLPHWHVMQARNLIRGVMSIGEKPIRIPEKQIGRIKGLERALQAEVRDPAEVAPGDRVDVVAGLFAGHTLDVREVRGGLAWVEGLGLLGRTGLNLRDLRRVG